MNKLKEWLVAALQVIFIIVVVLATEFYFVQKYTGSAGNLTRLFRVMKIVEDRYNGEVDKDKMFEGAMKGLVSAVGDPYTVYLDQKSFKNLSEATHGSFGGVGIVFGKREGKYVVISALEDGPSAKAGVKGGDVIVSVDGEATSSMDMEQIATKIRGKIGTEVTLELKYKEEESRKIRIIRKEIKNPSVAGKLLDDTSIGYIRISMFNENTGEDFKKTYKELEDKGMKATLLDLRGNPGGTLSDGVAVAGMLVPKGPIVSVTDKHGKTYTENSTLEKIKYPLAILVDGGTASAAEIVSGAVKDTKSGKLFGVKTFGKGSVQSIIYLGKQSAVKVTTAKYYTPSGVSIHNKGIEPDVIVELPEKPTFDNQLDAAKKYLLEELNK
ncbi:MAG: S41 family peptidase [Phascolarctobacterium sp.]|nr:S41 family peptidase [Phascolarctobacterium sp.]